MPRTRYGLGERSGSHSLVASGTELDVGAAPGLDVAAELRLLLAVAAGRPHSTLRCWEAAEPLELAVNEGHQ